MPLKLSVVMPVYNASETLADALAAICNQNHWVVNHDYEVILVDDGSSDSSREIAQKYPVKLIALGQNQGRLIARETGVKSALAEKILLIDTRVIVTPHLLDTYESLSHQYAIMSAGDCGEREQAEQSSTDRLYFALRRKYYYPYFPQRDAVIEIADANFHKIPKGTGCLFIDRATFLAAIPKEKGKHVNDDSKLFHHIIYAQKKPIFRIRDLKITYLQRQELSAQKNWLIGRGILFADFLLFKKKIFLYGYIASWLVLCTFAILLVSNPAAVFLGVAVLLALYVAILVSLATRPRDVFDFGTMILPMLCYFWWGIGRGLLKKTSLRQEAVK